MLAGSLRHLLFALGTLLGAAQCALASADAEAQFNALWQSEWAWRLQEQPLLASSVGVYDYDNRIDDVSAAAQQRRAKRWRETLLTLKQIAVAELSAEQAINATLYKAQLQSLIANVELESYLLSINSDASFYGDLLMLPRVQKLRTVQDFERYLERLTQIPRFYDQHIALLKKGLKRGMTAPQITLQGRADALAKEAANKLATDSTFYQPFAQLPGGVAQTEHAKLQARAKQIIETQVQPAHAKLYRFLVETYIPQSRKSIAASAMPNGKAFYQQQILDFVTEPMSPDAIHSIGLQEVETIRAGMEQILTELRESKTFTGDLAEFIRFLRTDPQFYARTPNELLAQASYIAKRADAALPRFFNVLPRTPYGVQAVPAGIAPFYTGGRYVPPAEGSSEPGWYWVNTYNLKSRPLYSLPALTLHEAVPGHHLQGALAREQRAQPAFRRHNYISVYGEGWALYCEALGHEMGIYETPYERFGQLSYAMWRANRLVVDTGIHAMGWSRDKAIAYMRDNTALSEHEITTEIDRYISWPGQALSYQLGAIRIRELRATATRELGDRFDIRAFHDAVLELGSVPLSVLSAHIDAWITAQRAAETN